MCIECIKLKYDPLNQWPTSNHVTSDYLLFWHLLIILCLWYWWSVYSFAHVLWIQVNKVLTDVQCRQLSDSEYQYQQSYYNLLLYSISSDTYVIIAVDIITMNRSLEMAVVHLLCFLHSQIKTNPIKQRVVINNCFYYLTNSFIAWTVVYVTLHTMTHGFEMARQTVSWDTKVFEGTISKLYILSIRTTMQSCIKNALLIYFFKQTLCQSLNQYLSFVCDCEWWALMSWGWSFVSGCSTCSCTATVTIAVVHTVCKYHIETGAVQVHCRCCPVLSSHSYLQPSF